MFLHELEIKKFRCFNQRKFEFNKPVTVIVGDNGSGKTSLAEAIHYLCYMKSFRTHAAIDLIEHQQDSFFLKGSFSQASADMHTIQVGYAQKKKTVKIDGRAIGAYKDVIDSFQVITLLEDDINLVKGSPTGRRSFIDQAVLFSNSEYLDVYRNFKRILQSRNMLLQKGMFDKLEMDIWTQKLWNNSCTIYKYRCEALEKITTSINNLLQEYFDDIYTVSIKYEAKYTKADETFDEFKHKNAFLFHQELLYKRSNFGAHLDDFHFAIKGKNARTFASRGQQKLVALLCKLSLVELAKQEDFSPTLIVDDFIADFDEKRLSSIVNFFIKCKNQVIITMPFYDSDLKKIIQKADPDVLSIKN